MNYHNELVKFERYLADRVSFGTKRVYSHALRQWFSTLNGTKPSQVSAQSYIDRLTKAGKSASTVNVRAHAIIRYFRWKGRPITLDCPTVRLGEVDYLTLDQIEELLAANNMPLEYTLITVLFDTAVRISELLNLELDDINWDKGFISVVRKGSRREEVNISDKALDALGMWLDLRESEYKRVFMDLTYYDAWVVLRNAGKRAGIRVHPQIFRHSRAVQLLRDGVQPYVVQQHLGHKNLATTMNIYGRFTATDLKKVLVPW